MKSRLELIPLMLVCAGAAVTAPAVAKSALVPFTILPCQDLPAKPVAGRIFYLPKHLLRLQVTFKVELARKLDEDRDPADPAVKRYYLTMTEAKPTGATVTSVRVRDEAHCYFMAAGQVTSFFRDKKFSATFSDDGFLLGTEASFEDKTLQIIADTAKAVLPFVASAQLEEKELTPEQLAKERDKAGEARRLKLFLANLDRGITQTQKELEAELHQSSPDPERTVRLTKALEALHTERTAAAASRSPLLAAGEGKSEIVVFTGDLDPAELLVTGQTLKAHSEVPIDWSTFAAWQEFIARMKREYADDVARKMIDSLDGARLTVDFVGTMENVPLDDAGKPPATYPFQGILLRQPVYAKATLSRSGDGGGPVVLGRSEGATLKFGQFGRLVAVPVKAHALLKGDFSIGLNADGEILKLGSSVTAAGGNLTAGVSAMLAQAQAYEKARATGGLETERLAAETAKMKAQLDYADTKAKYDAKFPPN